MKENISLIILGILTLLVGCSSANDENNSSAIVENEDISNVTLQFKQNTMEIAETSSIEQIIAMFSECELDTSSKWENSKGWIYKISISNAKNEEIAEIFVLDETTIRYHDSIYTCDKLSLSTLDTLSGFDREN